MNYCTLGCLIDGEVGIVGGVEKILKSLISKGGWNKRGGLENDHKYCGKGYGFLSQMYIKVILPSPHNEKG